MADLYNYLTAPPDASPEEQAQALSAALRQQRGIGTIAGLSGNAAFRAMAPQFEQQASQGEAQLNAAPMGRLNLAMAAQKANEEQGRYQRATDPNSFESKVARAQAGKFVPSMANDLESATSESLSGALPLAEKTYSVDERARMAAEAQRVREEQAKQNAEFHKQEIGLGYGKLNADQWRTATNTATGELFEQNTKTGEIRPVSTGAKVIKGAGSTAKEDQAFDKRLGDLSKDMDAAASSRSPFGQNQQKVNTAARLLGLLANGNNLDVRQQEELSIGLAALLSGSNAPAEGTIKNLVPPSTLAAGPTAIKEWLLNEPTGRGQQEFVQRMKETIERESGIAAGQNVESRYQRLPRHELLFHDPNSAHQEAAWNLVSGYGVNRDEVDPAKLTRKQKADAKAAGHASQAQPVASGERKTLSTGKVVVQRDGKWVPE